MRQKNGGLPQSILIAAWLGILALIALSFYVTNTDGLRRVYRYAPTALKALASCPSDSISAVETKKVTQKGVEAECTVPDESIAQ